MIDREVYEPPNPPWLSVVHADDEVYVIDKQAGLLSVPGKTPDLADCVEARAKAAFGRAFIVHRPTAGLEPIKITGREVDVVAEGVAVVEQAPAVFEEHRNR